MSCAELAMRRELLLLTPILASPSPTPTPVLPVPVPVPYPLPLPKLPLPYLNPTPNPGPFLWLLRGRSEWHAISPLSWPVQAV